MGGTWMYQNKVIPGAYINIVSKASTVGTLGDRGTVAVAMPMSWGTGAIKVTGEELLNGKSLEKIGVDLNDDILKYRVALSGANACWFYRTNENGTGSAKASVTVTDSWSIEAKYTGVAGNNIKVDISAGSTSWNVTVSMKDTVVEQLLNVTPVAGYETDFIKFVAVPTVITAYNAQLSGGADGSTQDLSGMYNALANKTWQCLAVYGCKTNTAYNSTIITAIENYRDNNGKKVQGVVYQDVDTPNTTNNEGIIVVHQGFKTATETVDEDLFPIWVASATAGANVNESLTARVVENAIEIIGAVDSADYEDVINDGRFFLAYRADGAIKVMKDINSFNQFQTSKNYEFSKNRVMRTLDEIANDIDLIFERNYEGKQSNDKTGRLLFKNELHNVLTQLYEVGAVDEPSMDDITVEQGSAIDAVVVTLGVRPIDAMEILYLTVEVDANN